MSDSVVHRVNSSFAQGAHINEEQYLHMYQQSIADPDSFWADQAE